MSMSNLWANASFIKSAEVPGLMTRTTTDKTFDTILEKWLAGSSEPPHSHPGDDHTIVVKGKMEIQFFKKDAGSLVADGDVLVLKQGESGLIKAGRIHDAKYVEDCELVYIHDSTFGFVDESKQ